MSKSQYHINYKTSRPNICHEPDKCEVESQHFDTKVDAESFIRAEKNAEEKIESVKEKVVEVKDNVQEKVEEAVENIPTEEAKEKIGGIKDRIAGAVKNPKESFESAKSFVGDKVCDSEGCNKKSCPRNWSTKKKLIVGGVVVAQLTLQAIAFSQWNKDRKAKLFKNNLSQNAWLGWIALGEGVGAPAYLIHSKRREDNRTKLQREFFKVVDSLKSVDYDGVRKEAVDKVKAVDYDKIRRDALDKVKNVDTDKLRKDFDKLKKEFDKLKK